MKLYKGTKKVYAQPITYGEFKEKHGRDPYKGLREIHFDDEKGYEVQYNDGYTSYSPRDIFEESYQLIETVEDSLKAELNTIDKHIKEIDLLTHKTIRNSINVCEINEQELEALRQLTAGLMAYRGHVEIALIKCKYGKEWL